MSSHRGTPTPTSRTSRVQPANATSIQSDRLMTMTPFDDRRPERGAFGQRAPGAPCMHKRKSCGFGRSLRWGQQVVIVTSTGTDFDTTSNTGESFASAVKAVGDAMLFT